MGQVLRWVPKHGARGLPSLLLLGALLVCQGCQDATAPGMAMIQVRLTDAPADAVASTQVWISRAYLQGCEEGEEEETCEAVDLYNDPDTPLEFDLMTLQDGVTANLTELTAVEARIYRQLRLVVDRARVTLAEGYTFAGAEEPANVADLKVPSGFSSGIKVHLTEAIDAETEDVTIILVDFDVEQNFVLQGNDQDMVIDGVIFTPTLTEKSRSHQPG